MRACLLLALWPLACMPADRPFPLRAPVWQDADFGPVGAPCRREPTPTDPGHVSCAPETYESPPFWDEADSLVFRPLTETLAVDPGGESVDVNSVDEVPDSSWFTNRLGTGPTAIPELLLGGCDPSQILDPESATDGSWVIDRGKTNGNSPGFRVTVPGKGKYLFKLDDERQPELSSAASVIGAAAYHAAGYNTTCEQIVYLRPSLLRLTPGLRYKFSTFGDEHAFDRIALEKILSSAPRRGDRVRMVASAWLPGHLLGPFRYEGTRADDANDVVPHEDRRELCANRVLAAWLGHVDASEKNSIDLWFAARSRPTDASPGHVVHSYLDWGDCLGADWPQEEVTRRMGYSYIFDWGDMAADFARLGVVKRPWEDGRARGHELFGYFDVEHFEPARWKNEYPNAAFTRMTEHDAAWMARILARFTPDMVRALAAAARFSDERNTDYLGHVLEGRLERILDRYLTRLSPLADIHVEGDRRLCATDLLVWRGMRASRDFHPSAHWDRAAALPMTSDARGRACVELPHVAPDGGASDDAPSRYVRVALRDGIALGPLRVHLYDLGPTRGFHIAGVERIDR